MTYPVTGPFTSHIVRRPPTWAVEPFQTDNSNTLYEDFAVTRTWYRQKRPYDLPLEFSFRETRVLQQSSFPHWEATNSTGHGSTKAFGSSGTVPFPDGLVTAAKNRALGRLQDRLTPDTVDLAINLHQRNQAMEMIGSRLLQLYRFVKNLKSFRWGSAFRDLEITTTRHRLLTKRFDELQKSRRLRREARAFGDNFLEFHFGWEPLLRDIHAGIELLEQKPKPFKITSSARERVDRWVVENDPPGVTGVHSPECRVRMGAVLRSVNHDALLANALGLVNPALVLWDAIPFSFLVDHIVNVGQWLRSFTGYIGCELEQPWTSVGMRDTVSWTYPHNVYRPPNYYPWDFVLSVAKGENMSLVITRSLGLPSVQLHVALPSRVSPTKALTYISLLLQGLKAGPVKSLM